MPWPSPQDYNEAVQTPLSCFLDEELRLAQPECNNLGLPRASSGAFASVYKLIGKGKQLAVRFFLRDIEDQDRRYEELSNFVLQDNLPYTVDFSYLKRGIKIRGTWFPVLKMNWVSGRTLDAYVRDHADKPQKLFELAEKFAVMCADLKAAGIAHGDLQHGNVMIDDQEELRLVDYDGMFVPALRGWQSNELGHPNYQHPLRHAGYFGAELDDFSAWVIYCSLRSLSWDPNLMEQLNCGDDALLYRRRDYLDPLRSPAFLILENHSDQRVRNYACWIRSLVYGSLESISPFDPSAEIKPAKMPAVIAPVSLPAAVRAQGVSWEELRKYYELDRPSTAAAKDAEIVWVRAADYQPGSFARAFVASDPGQVTVRKTDGVTSSVIALTLAALVSFPASLISLEFGIFSFVAALIISYTAERRVQAARVNLLQDLILAEEPAEVTLEFFRRGVCIYFRIWRMYGDAALRVFTMDYCSREYRLGDSKEFLKLYPNLVNRRYRCYVFLDPEDDSPVAMVDNVRFMWLI